MRRNVFDDTRLSVTYILCVEYADFEIRVDQIIRKRRWRPRVCEMVGFLRNTKSRSPITLLYLKIWGFDCKCTRCQQKQVQKPEAAQPLDYDSVQTRRRRVASLAIIHNIYHNMATPAARPQCCIIRNADFVYSCQQCTNARIKIDRLSGRGVWIRLYRNTKRRMSWNMPWRRRNARDCSFVGAFVRGSDAPPTRYLCVYAMCIYAMRTI